MKSAALSLLSAATLAFTGGCVIEISDHGWGWHSSDTVWVETTKNLEFSAADLDAVSAETHNGSLTVRSGEDTETVLVKATIKGGGEDEEEAQEALSNIELYKKTDGGTLELGWKWKRSKHRRWKAQVAYEITQPEKLDFLGTTHNGRVSISGISGNTHVTTHNGRIEIKTSSNDLYAKSHNGRIEVEGQPSKVKLETHNGRIVASLLREGSLSGSIQTHNGGVQVRLSDAASTKLVCSTGNGSIRAHKTFKDVTTKRRFLVGELGNGDGKLEVETHNGSITVE